MPNKELKVYKQNFFTACAETEGEEDMYMGEVVDKMYDILASLHGQECLSEEQLDIYETHWNEWLKEYEQTGKA